MIVVECTKERGRSARVPAANVRVEKATTVIAAPVPVGGAEEVGANPEVVAKAKASLTKCEKDFKALSVKNESDKQHAVEVTQKSIKKKGKKKK